MFQMAIIYPDVMAAFTVENRLPSRIVFLDLSVEAAKRLQNTAPVVNAASIAECYSRIQLRDLVLRFVCEMEGVRSSSN